MTLLELAKLLPMLRHLKLRFEPSYVIPGAWIKAVLGIKYPVSTTRNEMMYSHDEGIPDHMCDNDL